MTDLPPETTPDEICAVLAHELRNPLSTVEGYLDLLANGGVGPITDEQRDFLEVVRRNVRRMATSVGDWYELARIEAGGLELCRAPIDLEEVADRAIAELRPQIRSKEQQITVQPSAVPCIVVGDRRSLMRAVVNLLSNAHKYTPAGGEIRVALRVEDHRIARLDVIDSGIGIRDEDQPHLFRKFYRAHLTGAEPGMGLGLVLTRALIDRMGGQVAVQSTLGSGSTFSILLPRQFEAGGTPDATPAGPCAEIGDEALDPAVSRCPTP